MIVRHLLLKIKSFNNIFKNLKRVYRSYRSRENEYYMEIDSKYEKQLSELLGYIKKARLKKRKYRKVVYKEGEER